MTLQMILVGVGLFALFVVYAVIRLKQANKQVEKALKEVEQLEAQKAVAQTQVKNFETRKKNEENNHSTTRDQLLERLQQSGDLRD